AARHASRDEQRVRACGPPRPPVVGDHDVLSLSCRTEASVLSPAIQRARSVSVESIPQLTPASVSVFSSGQVGVFFVALLFLVGLLVFGISHYLKEGAQPRTIGNLFQSPTESRLKFSSQQVSILKTANHVQSAGVRTAEYHHYRQAICFGIKSKRIGPFFAS